jgi:hypothetical protein
MLKHNAHLTTLIFELQRGLVEATKRLGTALTTITELEKGGIKYVGTYQRAATYRRGVGGALARRLQRLVGLLHGIPSLPEPDKHNHCGDDRDARRSQQQELN